MSIRAVVQMLFRGKPRMLQAGEKAPDFDATDQNGNRVRLRDLAGRKVVLWFYPKADTPG